jgi:pyruvate,water dikinase
MAMVHDTLASPSLEPRQPQAPSLAAKPRAGPRVNAAGLAAHPALQRRYRFFKSLLAANNVILEELTALERLMHEGRSFTKEDATARVRRLVDRAAPWWKT